MSDEQQTTDLQKADQGAAHPPAKKPMSQLQVTKGHGVQLQTGEDVKHWANFVCQTGLNPPGLRNAGEVIIATLKGYELGISPTEALSNIAVINQKPSVYGDLMLRLCYESGFVEDFEEWIEGEGEDRTAYCRTKRKGMKSEVLRKFSLGEARHAGLYPATYKDGKLNKRSPWNCYTDRMLQMRARAFALRDAYPDAIQGLRMIEEERDVEPAHTFDPTQTRQYQDAATDPLLTDQPESQQDSPDAPAEREPGADEAEAEGVQA